MRTVLIAIGIIFCLSCSAYSQAGKAKALPQSPASSTIKGKDQKQILGYVRGLTETPGEIDEKIERLLMKAVPKEYAQGCKSLVGTWGKKAAKSSAMLLRPLYLHQEPGHVGQLLLSLTCYSTLP